MVSLRRMDGSFFSEARRRVKVLDNSVWSRAGIVLARKHDTGSVDHEQGSLTHRLTLGLRRRSPRLHRDPEGELIPPALDFRPMRERRALDGYVAAQLAGASAHRVSVHGG